MHTPAINPSMNATTIPDALYYPFHLCHPATLELMLERYATVHFRDYMAIQLTPLTGTTAYQDRMGDQFPDLVRAGRIVQGYHVSGPLTGEVAEAVDQDLADSTWRTMFHHALSEDRRFQRGLFDVAHGTMIGRRLVPGPAALLTLLDSRWVAQVMTLEAVRRLSRSCGARPPVVTRVAPTNTGQPWARSGRLFLRYREGQRDADEPSPFALVGLRRVVSRRVLGHFHAGRTGEHRRSELSGNDQHCG